MFSSSCRQSAWRRAQPCRPWQLHPEVVPKGPANSGVHARRGTLTPSGCLYHLGSAITETRMVKRLSTGYHHAENDVLKRSLRIPKVERGQPPYKFLTSPQYSALRLPGIPGRVNSGIFMAPGARRTLRTGRDGSAGLAFLSLFKLPHRRHPA